MRNQINDKFFKIKDIKKSIITTIIKFFSDLSIIIIIMPDFSADFLIQKEAVLNKLVSNIAKKIKKNVHLSRIIIYKISITSFLIDEDLDMLKNEIKIFNS